MARASGRMCELDGTEEIESASSSCGRDTDWGNHFQLSPPSMRETYFIVYLDSISESYPTAFPQILDRMERAEAPELKRVNSDRLGGATAFSP